MERCLSLVLDEIGNVSLTLEKMEAKELDAFIAKNFNSSEEIRKKYAAKIDPYLEQHKSFITKVELDNNKKYSGSIVITELQDDLTIKKKQVLYKKQLIIFKEITKNRKFVSVLENRDYINYRSALKNGENYDRIFDDYDSREIRFRIVSDEKYNRVMAHWRNKIKGLNRYYDLIRTVLKEYKNRYKDLGLDSPDVVYSSYLAGQELRRKSAIEEEKRFENEIMEALRNEDNHDVEPVRYKSGADEDGYPGDLERLDNSQISDEDLEEGMSSSKTKILSNRHHKLFGFDN